jgi:hypothetical protein
MGERKEIEIRTFAAQREFEAGFAIRVSVTGACVTTGLGNDRHHIVAEGNGSFGVSTEGA